MFVPAVARPKFQTKRGRSSHSADIRSLAVWIFHIRLNDPWTMRIGYPISIRVHSEPIYHSDQ
jgi:hypothetical protein